MAKPDLSPLALMGLQVSALFTHDDQGRLLTVNVINGPPAPRFFLGRTSEGHLWRFRDDLEPRLVDRLEDLCRREPIVSEPSHLPRYFDDYLNLLEDSGEAPRVWSGPAYTLHNVQKPPLPTVLITARNHALLNHGLDEWLPDVDHCQPMVAAVQDGRAVSLCASVRITELAHEAGVETLPAYRRRGLARHAVVGWSRAVARSGAVPLYSTSWTNLASQALAQRCGFRLYGVDFHVT